MWPSASLPLVGMGCMRLSTDPDRDEARALGVLHAAFDAGITFLDTADAYCHASEDTGHNERLIARAIATWQGDRSRILVATKGGLTRPQGHWIADGRARYLRTACEASLRALGVDRLALYQLHAPDPRAPFATSVRALDGLMREGLIDAVGLCNVTVGQIAEARRITNVGSVQVELSPWKDDTLLNGVVAYCAEHDIRLIAHRPLGGVKRVSRAQRDPALVEVAVRHGRSPVEIALAWLRDLSPVVTPIAGATRIETAQSIARAHAIVLTDDDRQRLEARFPSARLRPHSSPDGTAARKRDGDVVVIMGLPASGKSTMALALTARGYSRLNRDERGGTLRQLLPALDGLIESGATRIVLDNTYLSRTARGPVVQWAAMNGLPARCVWMSAGIDDAQVSAATRMVRKYGRLLEPDEIRSASRRDPNSFAPMVLFRLQRELEPPDISEGFSSVERVPFERLRESSYTNPALIVWCDGVLARSRSGRRVPASPDDLEVIAGRGETLQRYASRGCRVAALSWQPEVEEGTMTIEQVEAVGASLRDRLGVPMEFLYCPHAAGPPACWCRKPLPGLGVVLIERHQLDPAACVCVGQGPQDPGFARKLGFEYRDATEFFAVAAPGSLGADQDR